MTDDRKAAEQAVKAAEKAYASAKKKADAALEKAREAGHEHNVAARALQYARSNPALFDDDPLRLVDPDFDHPMRGEISGGRIVMDGPGGAVRNVTVSSGHVGPLVASPAAITFEGNAVHPTNSPALQVPPAPNGVVIEESVAAPPAPAASAEQPELPPWQQPPAEAEKPAPRRRRIAAKPKEGDAPAAPPAPSAPAAPPPPSVGSPDEEEGGDMPVAFDSAGNPVQFTAPTAPF